MSLINIVDGGVYTFKRAVGNPTVVEFDLGGIVDVISLGVELTVNTTVVDDANGVYLRVGHSSDGVTFTNMLNAWSSGNDYVISLKASFYDDTDKIYISIDNSASINPVDTSEIDIFDVTVNAVTLIPSGIDYVDEPIAITMNPEYGGLFEIGEITSLIFDHITNPVIEGGGGDIPELPTSTNIITGNVKKLGVPFSANVVAVSMSPTPAVIGSAVSDESTGDYSIDVYPHNDEVMIYVAPDYGKAFSAELLMTTGGIIHPPTPNQYVYVAQNDGKLALFEPVWVTTGLLISGEVTLKVEPLHKPLMNGFIKPVVTPI